MEKFQISEPRPPIRRATCRGQISARPEKASFRASAKGAAAFDIFRLANENRETILIEQTSAVHQT
jgi:hypothetical protein